MQKFIILIFILMFFVISCGGSKKAENNAESQQNDSVDEDIDASNNEISDDDSEQSDIEEMSDQSDSQDQSDEDSDTAEIEDDDSTSLAKYNSPYGSVSFDFSGYIGTTNYPVGGNDFMFSGTYGNGSTPILPEDLDYVRDYAYITDSDFFSDDIRDQYILIHKAEYYSDNPEILFYIPIKTASQEGVHHINYDYKDNVSLLIIDIDWDKMIGKCINAFAEGEIEITKGFVEDEYGLSFRGEAKLYNPLNYKGNDISTTPSISEFFIKFAGTDEICDPVD